MTVVAPNGQILLIGGVNKEGKITDTVHMLDPVQHTITKLASMLVKRIAGSACYVPSSLAG